jgi:hypothetical protein
LSRYGVVSDWCGYVRHPEFQVTRSVRQDHRLGSFVTDNLSLSNRAFRELIKRTIFLSAVTLLSILISSVNARIACAGGSPRFREHKQPDVPF